MAAARTADRAGSSNGSSTGLSTLDLEHIRDTLAGGRRPKVVFTAAAGQIAGQQGQVVELIDPDVNDEWVVVRFGHDELPFSPTDLAIPSRATPTKRATKTAAPPAAPKAPPGPPLAPGLTGAPAPARPVNPVPMPREESTVTRPASTAKTTSAKTTKATGAKAAAAEPAAPPPAEAKAADTKPADAKAADAKAAEAKPVEGKPVEAKPAKAPARKAGRAKAPATLTVTLTYSDGEWMVGAQQGSKALAKPYVIRAAEALKMVGMLDVPGVHEAVEEIVASARAEAEAAADKLRTELAEIEARLAELREAG